MYCTTAQCVSVLQNLFFQLTATKTVEEDFGRVGLMQPNLAISKRIFMGELQKQQIYGLGRALNDV